MTAPARMSGPDAVRLSQARVAAMRRYPGPIGQFISNELKYWQESGYRLGGHSLVMALVDELLKTEEAAA